MDTTEVRDRLRDTAWTVPTIPTFNGPAWPSVALAEAAGATVVELAAALRPRGIRPRQQKPTDRERGSKYQVRGYLVAELAPVVGEPPTGIVVEAPAPPEPKVRDHSWRLDAACVGEEDVMFPEPTEAGGHYDQVKLARARWLCHQCAVADECLDDAMETPAGLDLVGVRAGYLAKERRPLRQARRRTLAEKEDEDE